ncbi:hypothetical protein GCM10025857_10780 [Alicyclobacillus contaminans]|uniref:RrF2 family transcriptional regulator n=1 Tax=Alicyclobacillus contaminans TaxID=392016 RepID=UPI000A03990A|nr:Rrf2 family transcriptional regulator [Alicyclobacillus contaminans]GMA49721.1 hypothetical protein GCM10025857_10780 [Alicyclobacillus contaminans]
MSHSGHSIITTPRFRTAIHALAGLAINQCVQSSSSLAGHVNTHAAFLRRVLLPFVHAGIVEAREGRDGGYILKKSPEDLTLADIFMVVHHETSSPCDAPDCGARGAKLDKILDEVTDSAERQMIAALGQHTLADVLQRLRE